MSFRLSKNGDNILPFPGQRTVVAPDSTPLLPVLIVLHQETSTPGRVGNALRALGHPLDIRRPRFGDPLPDTLDRHAGAVVFGHSHLPLHERASDGFQIFNPGSPTERRRAPAHTMGMATAEAGEVAFELIPFTAS